MPKSPELIEFDKSHPWPDNCGITSLFKFHKIDLKNVGHLAHLFRDLKLYCPLPSQFNDPFECKPNFRWPSDAKRVQEIRRHLIKVSREHGRSRKEAEKFVSESINNPNFKQEIIFNAIQNAYAEMRICCFTTRRNNLLLWSHYADSHKGFCIEYDASTMPLAYAYKVRYKNKYPEVLYPRPNDARAFIPALVKSKIWKYENEFRIILVPEAGNQPENDGISLLLKGNEIKNIYLGSNIEEKEKEVILNLVRSSKFNPGIWSTNLSTSSFSLEFTQIE